MNKVMQAAGRVIRTVNDKGVIALLDDRFLLPEYVALFPREWERYTVVNRFNVKQAVDDFWDSLCSGCSSLTCGQRTSVKGCHFTTYP